MPRRGPGRPPGTLTGSVRPRQSGAGRRTGFGPFLSRRLTRRLKTRLSTGMAGRLNGFVDSRLSVTLRSREKRTLSSHPKPGLGD